MKLQPDPKRDTGPNPSELTERFVYRRAVEAVIWGMPRSTTTSWYRRWSAGPKAPSTEIAYWSRLPDWKIQTLTPNPDAIYLTPYTNTARSGRWCSRSHLPMKVRSPAPSWTAGNAPWRTSGRPARTRAGGGKYLILPPGYRDQVPAGFIPLQSDTYEGYALLRSIPKSGSEADVAKAVAYGKRIKLYPLSQAAKPPATTFVDVVDIVYDSTIPYDLRFFESLDRIVQAEPWLERDKAMIDQLKSIGIEKGKALQSRPEDQGRPQRRGPRSARLARGPIRGVLFIALLRRRPLVAAGIARTARRAGDVFRQTRCLPVDVRGVTFSYAYFTPKHMGAGSSYLLTIADKEAGSSTVARPIASRCRRTHRSGSTGRRRSTTAPPMRPYGMPDGRAARPRRRDCKER
jgi:hypothetical protein